VIDEVTHEGDGRWAWRYAGCAMNRWGPRADDFGGKAKLRGKRKGGAGRGEMFVGPVWGTG
jgi:hypothetical protein